MSLEIPSPRASDHIGFITGHRDWGVIAKCPHCDATNIVRLSPKQKLCGSWACKLKQGAKRDKRRKV